MTLIGNPDPLNVYGGEDPGVRPDGTGYHVKVRGGAE